LGVVEEEAVDGSITTCYETAGKPVDIETLHACFSTVSASDELYESVGVIPKEINYLI
jgi:chorismate-pyruvate lyase